MPRALTSVARTDDAPWQVANRDSRGFPSGDRKKSMIHQTSFTGSVSVAQVADQDFPRPIEFPLPQPQARPSGVYRRVGKRLFDIAVVLLTAPFIVPLVALLALGIRRDGGPAFYVQDRVGADGRIFRMWKLRSMTVDADARLEALLDSDPQARREWARSQKLRNDPRTTALGRAIRKASLDELPQLLNVLKGDMSLVGPRPMLPEQQKIYPGRSYYHMRPGLTGNWQVSSRNESSFADRARFDQAYDERLSLWTDLLLLVATVKVILSGTGY